MTAPKKKPPPRDGEGTNKNNQGVSDHPPEDDGRHAAALFWQSLQKPTFAELVVFEPRLGQLLNELKAIKTQRRFCANSIWYGYGQHPSYRAKMSSLVGWARRSHPILGTSAAYDVAYDALYGSLPNCRKGCACQVIRDAARDASHWIVMGRKP